MGPARSRDRHIEGRAQDREQRDQGLLRGACSRSSQPKRRHVGGLDRVDHLFSADVPGDEQRGGEDRGGLGGGPASLSAPIAACGATRRCLQVIVMNLAFSVLTAYLRTLENQLIIKWVSSGIMCVAGYAVRLHPHRTVLSTHTISMALWPCICLLSESYRATRTEIIGALCTNSNQLYRLVQFGIAFVSYIFRAWEILVCGERMCGDNSTNTGLGEKTSIFRLSFHLLLCRSSATCGSSRFLSFSSFLPSRFFYCC